MKHPLAVHHLLIAFFTLFLAACGGGGGGGSSSAGATAAVGPSVSITAVNPQTPVAGQVVAFTASGSGTGLSYAWNFGDNSVAGTGASVNHTYDHGSYTVTVTVTDSTGATAQASATVVVSKAPVAASIGSIAPATPLAGQLVTFTGTGSGLGAVTYSWSFGDGSPAGTGASPTHTYSTAGSYTVTLTVTDSENVTATASNGVTVVAVPTAQISSISKSSPDVGQTVSFVGVGSGTGALSYAWTFGDGSTGTGSSVSHAYAATGTDTVGLTVTDSLGHTAQASGTVSVASNAPTAHITSANTGTTNKAMTFSSSATGQGTLSYAWTFGDGSTGTGASPSHTYTASGSYPVTLVVTDAAGDTGNASASIAITNPAVFASITGASPLNALVAQAETLGSTASGGIGAYTYAWNFGDNSTGTGASPSHTWAKSGPYTVTLTVTDSVGTVSSPASFGLTVNDPPAPSALSITPGQLNPALNVTDTFTATASGSSPLSYAWNFGDGSATTTATTNTGTSHIYTTAGTFTVTLTVTDPYSQTAQATSTVTVAPGLGLLAGVLGGAGNVNGTGAAAAFDTPSAVAVDKNGNRYVADSANNVIRLITAGGEVSTLAGTVGVAGSNNGQGTAASFNNPTGVAVDKNLNVYVADTGNNMIREISSTGMVSTLAGSTTSGGSDGTGSGASFNGPQGVAVDGSGNVFVADTQNSTIREIVSGGVVSTLAGMAGNSGWDDDTGPVAQFDLPQGVAVDSSGNVYVADTGNDVIRMVTTGASPGITTTLAGTPGSTGDVNGDALTVALFSAPSGIAVSSAGNVYVVDQDNNDVRVLNLSASTVTTLAGTGGVTGSADGTGAAVQFNGPMGLALDGSGNVLVADTDNDTIRQITPVGVSSTIAGSASVLGISNGGSGVAATFNTPYGVATDKSGNVYVADTSNNVIRKITPAGVVSVFAGSGSVGSGNGAAATASFNNPDDVAVDSSGNVYVADTGNDLIRKISSSGQVSTLAGVAGTAGAVDGILGVGTFNGPSSLAVASNGTVYVADELSSTIRAITPSGTVSTLAGSAGVAGSTDGAVAAARFNFPSGLTLDSSGNIYVADSGNNTIREISGGVVSTIAGSVGQTGSSDGNALTTALFNDPWSVAVDSSGNVYVADTGNSTIRKITPSGTVGTPATVSTMFGVAGEVGNSLSGTMPALSNPSDLTLLPNGNMVFITGLGAIVETAGL